MRIAFLSPSAQLGGAETSLLAMLASLRAAAPSWSLLLVAAADGPLATRARALGVCVTVVPFPDAVARLGETGATDGGGAGFARQLATAASGVGGYVGALRAAIGPFGADVVHTNGLKMHLLGAYAADAPVVWHVHDYIGARRVSRHLLRWSAGRCASVIANSDSVAADVRAALGSGVEITRVYNGVDLARFSPAGDALDLDRAASLPPAPSSIVRVGLVATFARWKGHETFLRAIAALPSGVPVRAYVVGGPVYQTDRSQHSFADLRAMVSALGLADRVGFTGFVERVDTALRALDIVVHASTSPEPFGLAIAEAMACGRALVCSGAGGALELVTPGVDALVHTPGNVDALASAIRELAADAARRRSLGAAARATAERRFDAARLAVELMPIYERVASRAAATIAPLTMPSARTDNR